MKQQEKYTADDILNSMDGAARATPPNGLFERIAAQLNAPVKKVKTVSLVTFSAAAASIVLLVAVNIAVLQQRPKHAVSENEALQQIVDYYDITNDKDILKQ